MKNEKSIEKKILENFIKKCKDLGLKITPQRIAIYKEILNSSDHPSAETIYRNLRDTQPHISFDTVNRTLLTLAEMEIIQIVEGSGDVRRFDPNAEPHHHLRCLKCGAIADFFYKKYNNLTIPKEVKEKFLVKKTRVVIEGICDSCRKSLAR
ncbi:MAG: Fur family transcriptional regulator [Thermodesulfobacteriota bacterium]